jgi:hypothetical protein
MYGMSSVSAKTFLYYCSFHGNTAGTSGRDVYVYSNYFGDTATPFLGCYSTTGVNLNRCMQYTTNKDEWLTTVTSPLDQVVNVNGEKRYDGYGCGIGDEFPCESEEAKNNHPLPFPPYTSNNIYIKSGGDSDSQCGTQAKPCDSFETRLSHFNTDANEKPLFIQSICE